MRQLLLIFAVAALAVGGLAPGPALAADAVTPEQKAAFERIIHDYLLQHPEVLVQALQAAEDKAKADQEAAARSVLVKRRDEVVNDPTSPVAGNPNGDVTLVEFFDYRCPYCKQVEPALQALLHEDGRIRLVYKEFPILGKDSVYASRAALAARKQGKYDAFHGAMMAAKGKIDEQVVLQVAKTVGLDLDQLKKDMDAPDVEDVIKRTFELAQALDIRGTPAFVIGSELVPGAIDIATMREKIAAARKAG